MSLMCARIVRTLQDYGVLRTALLSRSRAACRDLAGIVSTDAATFEAKGALPSLASKVGEALSEAVETTYETTPVRVLRAEHLVAIMLQTGRDKDRQRFSTYLAEVELDRAQLESIVQRHQLIARWKQWTS